ncbi:hypothetical protein [Salinivibrio socompensis]|uniref:hypothetical protein n=1 Tax=Salinivibrio socompensis TaxID=1510206 RepID=UPI000683DF08|nr:hypothetical protein [Salinivibrio socompensis]
MPTAEWWEFLLVILGLVLGGYLVLWSIPAVFILAILALNDIKRIEFIDQQLAEDVKNFTASLIINYLIRSSIDLLYTVFTTLLFDIAKRPTHGSSEPLCGTIF